MASNGDHKKPPSPSPLRSSKFLQSNMRILVTGGAGFIGSHLVDRLMENEKNEVIVADNYFTGSKDNLKKWIGHPRFELIRHDVTETLRIEVDQIYHLACPASPIFYKHNPVKTIKTNVIGTLNMLGLAKRVGARILLTSTSEVYGDPLVHPQTEDYWGNVNPIGVRSCYDEGKRVAETLMFDYHRQHGIEIRIARIFNTYGPRMNIDDGRVVSNFIAQALRGGVVVKVSMLVMLWWLWCCWLWHGASGGDGLFIVPVLIISSIFRWSEQNQRAKSRYRFRRDKYSRIVFCKWSIMAKSPGKVLSWLGTELFCSVSVQKQGSDGWKVQGAGAELNY